jgi:hypothetical protein
VTSISEYQIQPPKGFTPTGPNDLDDGEFYWHGPRRGEKDGATFMVKVWPDQRGKPPDSKGVTPRPLTVDEYFAAAQGRTRQLWENWQAEAPERFTSNGLSVIGTRWKAIDRESQRPFRGFVYVALDGTRPLEISGDDAEPHHEELLKAASAAVRTLRKR